jgi:hypothetical protein
MDIYPISFKHCTNCNSSKSIENFNKNKSTTDGFNHWCKDCSSITIKKSDFLKDYYQSKKDAKAYNNANLRRYTKKREQDNPLVKVQRVISAIIRSTLKRKGYDVNSPAHEILGCTYEEFKLHIEQQFSHGMTWDNHGEWHLDHKIPVSYGLNVEEVIALNNYINFQPLWAKVNLSKGNRYMD